MIIDKFLKGYFKDSKDKPVYVNSDTKILSDNVYLGKNMVCKQSLGGIQKDEFLPKGWTVNEVLNLMINGSLRKNPFDKIEKVTDYLYYTEISDIDYSYGKEFCFDRYSDPNSAVLGACSSFRKGNFYYRNYDWYYDNKIEFIIRTKKSSGRYESIGLTSLDIDPDDISIDKFMWQYKYLPCHMLDGINEKGVVCNTNVAPFDKGITTCTNPELSEEATVSAAVIVRLILDKCATAKEAVDLIKNQINVVGPMNLNEEFHFMIADKKKTYIVEFINNKVVVMEPKKPIMTNFHLYNTKLNSDGTIDLNTVEKFAAGCERFDIVAKDYDSVTDINSGLETLKKIRYTNAYDSNQNPRWKTEFVGDYRAQGYDVILTAQDPIENFALAFEISDELFQNRSRDTAQTWQTVHSAIYDIENKKLKLYIQEDYNNAFEYEV